MPSEQMKLQISLAWWIKPYFWMVAAMCAITGREPDEEKVIYWIDRAIRVKVIP